MVKGNAPIRRQVAGEASCYAQKTAAAIDACDVITRVGQLSRYVARATTDVKKLEMRIDLSGGKLERPDELATNIRFGAGGQFARVVARTDFKEDSLKGIAEQVSDGHGGLGGSIWSAEFEMHATPLEIYADSILSDECHGAQPNVCQMQPTANRTDRDAG